jgi:hypothetical protein
MTEPGMIAPDGTRIELKFVVPALALPRVRAWTRLHRAGFHTAYPPRTVNNVYFDTRDLASVRANLDGIAQRGKLRLRWYGQSDVIDGGVLELKCKQGSAGWKRTHKVTEVIDLTTRRWPAIVETLRADAPRRFSLALETACHPAILNRYRREYLISSDGRVRITLDRPQTVYTQWHASRPNLTRAAQPEDVLVLEIKAHSDQSDRLSAVVDDLPGIVARHSKYVQGVHAAWL